MHGTSKQFCLQVLPPKYGFVPMHATRRVQLTDKIIAVYVLIFMFVGAEEDIWALEG